MEFEKFAVKILEILVGKPEGIQSNEFQRIVEDLNLRQVEPFTYSQKYVWKKALKTLNELREIGFISFEGNIIKINIEKIFSYINTFSKFDLTREFDWDLLRWQNIPSRVADELKKAIDEYKKSSFLGALMNCRRACELIQYDIKEFLKLREDVGRPLIRKLWNLGLNKKLNKNEQSLYFLIASALYYVHSTISEEAAHVQKEKYYILDRTKTLSCITLTREIAFKVYAMLIKT
jgi:hypothetical protein